jgi:hypothetical protein
MFCVFLQRFTLFLLPTLPRAAAARSPTQNQQQAIQSIFENNENKIKTVISSFF